MTNFSCLSAVHELIIFEDYFVEVYCYNLLKKTGILCFIVVVFCFIHLLCTRLFFFALFVCLIVMLVRFGLKAVA